MNYAVVDTGSNTIRLSVYKYENEHLCQLFTEAVFANLAGHIFNNSLTDDGILACCDAISKHKETAKKYDAALFVFATAAIRNAKNTEEIIEKVKENTGVTLEILSGDDEGELSFLGAKEDFPKDDGIMADIGGGSSEVVAYQNGVPFAVQSIPLGSLSAYKKFVKGELPSPSEVKIIKNEIIHYLNKNKAFSNINSKNICLVGGGAMTAHSLCEMFFGENLTVKNVKNLLSLLLSSPDASKILEKAIPKRKLTITPGLAIYSAICEYFSGEQIFVSDKGIKEGYVLKYLIH